MAHILLLISIPLNGRQLHLAGFYLTALAMRGNNCGEATAFASGSEEALRIGLMYLQSSAEASFAGFRIYKTKILRTPTDSPFFPTSCSHKMSRTTEGKATTKVDSPIQTLHLGVYRVLIQRKGSLFFDINAACKKWAADAQILHRVLKEAYHVAPMLFLLFTLLEMGKSVEHVLFLVFETRIFRRVSHGVHFHLLPISEYIVRWKWGSRRAQWMLKDCYWTWHYDGAA